MINVFCDRCKDATIHIESDNNYIIFTCNRCGDSIKQGCSNPKEVGK